LAAPPITSSGTNAGRTWSSRFLSYAEACTALLHTHTRSHLQSEKIQEIGGCSEQTNRLVIAETTNVSNKI
jgi:hypothetical protein